MSKMPGKKKKYNARFPPARIKKIMQTDEEVGKVASAVPVIISRALELFAENLLNQANKVTVRRGARTLTPSHLKFCIENEGKFDFLRDMVSNVPDLQDDDLEMEGTDLIIPTQPSKPRPKPMSLNGRSDSNDSIFKEPRNLSRESTPGSPHTFPSPTVSSPVVTTPSSRGLGSTQGKRRGRPPKHNGVSGRGYPPMPSSGSGSGEDKKRRKLSDESSVTSGQSSSLPDDSDEIECITSSSTPASGENKSNSVPSRVCPVTRKPIKGPGGPSVASPLTSATSSPLTSAATTTSTRHHQHLPSNGDHSHQGEMTAPVRSSTHSPLWTASSKGGGAFARSNSTPSFTFSLSPLATGGDSTDGSAGGKNASSHGGNTAPTTPSFTINVPGGIPVLSRPAPPPSTSTSKPSPALPSSSQATTSIEVTSSSLSIEASAAGTSSKQQSAHHSHRLSGKMGHSGGSEPHKLTLKIPPPPHSHSSSSHHTPTNHISNKKQSSAAGSTKSTPSSAGTSNHQQNTKRGGEGKLYPREVFRGAVTSSNNSDINHSQPHSSAPMDLSLTASNDNGPSERRDGGEINEVEDLSLPTSRHNAAFSNLTSTKGHAKSATFSRFRQLDEDYDC